MAIDVDALLSADQVLGKNAAGTGLEGKSPSTFVAQAVQAANAQTGTSYTLVLTDANKKVTLSNASSVTLTVPPNSSVAFPLHTRIDLMQLGAGQVTVAQGSGVTVNVAKNAAGVDLFLKKLSGQNAEAGLVKTATDTWVLTGVLEAA